MKVSHTLLAAVSVLARLAYLLSTWLASCHQRVFLFQSNTAYMHSMYPLLPRGLQRLVEACRVETSLLATCGPRREMILPIAAYLGVPKDNVFANRMTWQVRTHLTEAQLPI